jgi:hypothetical protein
MRRLFLALVVLLACRSTFACDVFILTAQQAMDAADVVFVGQVESVAMFPTVTPGPFGWWRLPWPPHEGNRVSLRVSNVLKGRADERMAVWAGTGNNDCAFRFVTGQTYIVYARRDASGQLVTGIYSGTRLQ